MHQLTAYLPDLLLIYSAYVLAVASPGPTTMTIMSTAMSQGRRAAVAVALGVVTGSATWALTAAAGLSALLLAYSGAINAIRIVGGLYLLWLAWKSARSALHPTDTGPLVARRIEPLRRLYMRGLLMHWTNPKAILTWISLIALGLRPESPSVVMFAIIIGCLILVLLISIGYALIFSTRPMVNGYLRVRLGVDGVLAAFFGLAGLKLLTTRL